MKKVAENPDLPKWNGYANTTHVSTSPVSPNVRVDGAQSDWRLVGYGGTQ